jgi:hypothetical protein
MKGRPAIDLCDEAVHLLRSAPAGTIALYYVGSIPFILDLLFYWTDMSQSATARERAAPASLLLALLYIWMVTCQAMFARQLRGEKSGGWWRTACEQAAVQPTKFAVLPFASLLLIPYAMVYAFYHNFSALPSYSNARKQASLWPHQNWVFLSILAALSVVVFLNAGIALLMLPRLAKMLFGIDTVFTRSAYTFLNTTFLAATAGVSYLVLNPFVKAFYALRCFYGESVTTGRDLQAALRAASVLLVMVGALPAQPSQQDLDNSIDRVLQRPEYSWRTPRVSKPDSEGHNWFVRSTLGVLDWTDRSFKQIGQWIDALAERISNLAGKRLPNLPEANVKPPSRGLRTIVVFLLAMAVGVVMFLLWRWLAARRITRVATASPVAVDLRAEDLQADEQPFEQWLELAKECLERQDLRLALRALYLAGLSLLASESLISLERSKSDRDYARELKRKARHLPEVIDAFSSTLGVFERSWYGMYSVDQPLINQVQANLDRMRARAL